MKDYNLLERNYLMYYQSGKKFLDQQNLKEAKVSFQNAANCLLDMAAQLTGKAKDIKKDEARSILEVIAAIDKKLNPNMKMQQTSGQCGTDSEKDGRFKSVECTGVSFTDVVGAEDVKEFVRHNWIKRFDPKYEKAFSGIYHTNMERGMLLYGCPGTGKTMIAQSIATEVKADFYSVNASEIVDSLVGNTEKAIAELFEQASKKKRAIVFIDEIDSILAEPKGQSQNYEKSALNEWLKQMDGFEKEKMKNVICIGATNYPGDIAPSALRGGRLGAHFRVDLPNLSLRTQLIKKKLSKELFSPDVSIEYISKMLAGFTTSDVIAVCDRLVMVSQQKLMRAIDSGKGETNTTLTKHEAENVVANQHSSVSIVSLDAIEKFEKNLNISNRNGTVSEYMETLKKEGGTIVV